MWAQAPAHHAHESNEVEVQYNLVASQAGGHHLRLGHVPGRLSARSDPYASSRLIGGGEV